MNLLIVDAHCDTLDRLLVGNKNLIDNDYHINIKRMREYDCYIQFFAIWSDPNFYETALKRCLQMIDIINQYNSDIIIIKNKKNLKEVIQKRKQGAIITLEGCEPLMGDVSVLRTLYRLGVRSLSLTWNTKNILASGTDFPNEGLTPHGLTILNEINKLGILLDLSHISDRGFWDIINSTEKPVIASHSNAREICSHPRNLTKEQFLAIKNRNGVVGINFFPFFLNKTVKADISDIVRHIEYFMSLGGENNVGFGSDFDGIDKVPSGIETCSDIFKIINELLRLNYKESIVRKIAGENFLRVL